jgi:hypothetical protein
MKIEQLISEALTFKQARPYMKAWDPNFHKAVFEREPRTDRGARRIYLPFETEVSKPIMIPDQLQQYLRTAIANKPYMTDEPTYMQGLAYEVANPSRKLGIGKMLARSLASESDPGRKAELQDIKKTFDADPQRAATRKPDKLIVISRHPYDVAGMSTDRGWDSCMNIIDGMNRRYVLRDVKQGSIIAYLIQSDDMNIRKPLARILIRPYGQIGKPKNIAMMADRVYGTAPASFKTQVDAWVDKNYNQDKIGLFCVKPGLYIDDAPRRVRLLSDDALKSYTPQQVIAYLESDDDDQVEYKYARVARVRPDADAILTQVTLKGNLGAAKYIKQSPSLATFQKMADKFDGVRTLTHIQNPSEEIIAYSIKRDPRAVAYVKNRTEKQNQDLFKLIQKHPDLIYQVPDHKKLLQTYPDLATQVFQNLADSGEWQEIEHILPWTSDRVLYFLNHEYPSDYDVYDFPKFVQAFAQLDADQLTASHLNKLKSDYGWWQAVGPHLISLQSNPHVRKATPNLLAEFPELIKHMPDPTDNQIRAAILHDVASGGGNVLAGIFEYEPHKAMWDRLLKDDPEYVYWILNPPQKLLSQLISSWPKHRMHNLIDLWSQLNTANQVRLIRTHPEFIQYVKKPSLALQMAAVYRNPELITLIPPEHRHAATREFVRAFDQEMRKIERTS